MESKSPFASKTIWINVIMAAAAFFPSAQAYLIAHPESVATGFLIVNIVLRLITKDKISLSA